MEQIRLQSAAIGTGLVAFVVAITSGRLQRWLRITVVLAGAVLIGGLGLFAYRSFTQPTTLTIAAGSIDGDAQKIMSALAIRIAAASSPIRLKVVEKGNAAEAAKAFTAREVDLAIVRPDLGDLSSAQTVVALTRGVLLIIAPPGSPITSMDDLKGKTVGVIEGDVNRKLVDILTKQYDLDGAKVSFKDLAVNEVAQALKSRRVNALLVVTPISEKYLAMLRNLFPKNAKANPTLIPIEAAGAIAAATKYYESYDLPKGTVRGSPPIPDHDLTTLRVPHYIVANKKLSNDVVGSLAKAIMEAHRDLIDEYPLMAQTSQPESDKEGFIPIHPGALAYFNGDTRTFFDKYGDRIFFASMLLGSLTSLFAAAWKFMMKTPAGPAERPLARLYALADLIRTAASENELVAAENRIDDIFRVELQKSANGDAASGDDAILAITALHLQHLIGQRRAALGTAPVAAQAWNTFRSPEAGDTEVLSTATASGAGDHDSARVCPGCR